MLVSRTTVERQLQQMQGKTFTYGGKPHKVLSYEFSGADLKLSTSERLFFEPWADMYTTLLNDFLPADPIGTLMEKNQKKNLPVVNGPVPAVATPALPANPRPAVEVQTVKLFPELSKILMDNIARVAQNPDYVEQAQQVSLSARTLVDLAKTEIDALRAVRDIS